MDLAIARPTRWFGVSGARFTQAVRFERTSLRSPSPEASAISADIPTSDHDSSKSMRETQGWLGGVLRNRRVQVGGCLLVLLVLAALTATLWVKAGLLRDPIQQFPTGRDEDGMVRVIRAQVLSVKEREFIMASRALGASDARLIFGHNLPNIMPTIIVMAAMLTASTIMLEAGLPSPSGRWATVRMSFRSGGGARGYSWPTTRITKVRSHSTWMEWIF